VGSYAIHNRLHLSLQFPFIKLILHVDTDEWERHEKEVSKDEVAAFGVQKLLRLAKYNCGLESMLEHVVLLNNKSNEKEGFVALHFLGFGNNLIPRLHGNPIVKPKFSFRTRTVALILSRRDVKAN
jgi:hypothetical protein